MRRVRLCDIIRKVLVCPQQLRSSSADALSYYHGTVIYMEISFYAALHPEKCHKAESDSKTGKEFMSKGMRTVMKLIGLVNALAAFFSLCLPAKKILGGKFGKKGFFRRRAARKRRAFVVFAMAAGAMYLLSKQGEEDSDAVG